MKKYEKAEIEILSLEINDIITASGIGVLSDKLDKSLEGYELFGQNGSFSLDGKVGAIFD